MVPGLKNSFNCVSHPAVILLPHKLVFILDSQAETRLCDVGSWVHPRLSGVCRACWVFVRTWGGPLLLTGSIQVLACQREEIWATFKLEPGLNPAAARCRGAFGQIGQKNPTSDW